MKYINKKSRFLEIKDKISFVFISLIILRIGSFITIPGIKLNLIYKYLEDKKNTLLAILNLLSGGSLSKASIFSLGITPYISSSMIFQLISIINPYFDELRKEGEFGKKKINQYICYGALILSIIQSIGIFFSIPKIFYEGNLIFWGIKLNIIIILSLVSGTMFLIWLGDQISERGIINGTSLIIFTGIVSEFPKFIINIIKQYKTKNLSTVILFITTIISFLTTYFIVFIEKSQRKIYVSYARRHQFKKNLYNEQNTHLPIKINMSGVMPTIFASSVTIFPITILSLIKKFYNNNLIDNILYIFKPGEILYIIIYIISIFFFCFVYTFLIFNPKETSENLKKSGAFICGIRPGDQTSKYIHKIMSRLTLFGALYISFVCLIQEIMKNIIHIQFYFGGTSLLIVVVVIIEFISQIQTMLIYNKYEYLLKKINFKKNIK